MITPSIYYNDTTKVSLIHPGDECPSHTFTCANDQCIPMINVCDGVPDCDDYSDETVVCMGKYNDFVA